MNNKLSSDAIKKLDSIADDALTKLQKKLILFEKEGTYNVFGKYIIENTKKTSKVLNTSGNVIHNFYSIKNALAWCIFDYRNKFYDSRRIIDLDRQLSSIDIDIEIHKRLYKKSKKENREIYELKLSEDLIKRSNIVNLLRKYIISSNTWQINRFNSKV